MAELRARWRPVVAALDAMSMPAGMTRCPLDADAVVSDVFPHSVPCWTGRRQVVDVAAAVYAELRRAGFEDVKPECVQLRRSDMCRISSRRNGVGVSCYVGAESLGPGSGYAVSATSSRANCAPIEGFSPDFEPRPYPSRYPRIPLPSPSP